MDDKTKELIADLQYIKMYASDLQDTIELGCQQSSVEVCHARRMAELANKVLIQLEK